MTGVAVVFGVAGSGKSTVARAVAQELGWACLDADQFHSPENVAKMASGSPLTEQEFSSAAAASTNRRRPLACWALGPDEPKKSDRAPADRRPWLESIADGLSAASATSPYIVLACSCLRNAHRALLARRVFIPLTFFYLDVSQAEAQRRVGCRQQATDEGHFMPDSLVESQFRDLEPPNPAETVRILRVDGEAAPSDVATCVIGHLQALQ